MSQRHRATAPTGCSRLLTPEDSSIRGLPDREHVSGTGVRPAAQQAVVEKRPLGLPEQYDGIPVALGEAAVPGTIVGSLLGYVFLPFHIKRMLLIALLHVPGEKQLSVASVRVISPVISRGLDMRNIKKLHHHNA